MVGLLARPWLLFGALAFLLSIRPVFSDASPRIDNGREDSVQKEMTATAIHAINEITERRRLNRIFRNYQNTQHGFLIDVVNSSEGNLTFIKRDLVYVGRLPIVFGRVYDSRITKDHDGFGSGWKLTVSESVRVDGSVLYFSDANHSIHRLETRAGRVLNSPKGSHGIEGGRITERYIILSGNGLTRRFRRAENEAKLASISDSYGNSLSFEYQDGVLNRIRANDTRVLELTRDTDGRILRAVTDNGRAMTYEYNANDQLERVFLGKQLLWEYSYDERGLLTEMQDSEGLSVMSARFDAENRVSRLQKGFLQNDFSYYADRTVVSSEETGSSTFISDEHGKTVGFLDGAGNRYELLEGRRGRTTVVTHNGVKISEVRLARGRPIVQRIFEPTGTARSFLFRYDDDGKLQSIRRPGGAAGRRFEYYEDGSLKTKVIRGRAVTFRWGEGGELSEILRDGKLVLSLENTIHGRVERATYGDGSSVEFGHDPLLQIESISHSSEGSRAFSYNPFGFREQEISGDGLEIKYAYDSRGNLRKHGIRRDGIENVDEYNIGPRNELLSIVSNSGLEFEFEYDSHGWLKQIRALDKRLFVDYDDNRRLALVRLDEQTVFENPDAGLPYFEEHELHAADDRTFETYQPRKAGFGIFGSKAELIDNRTVAEDYPLVRYDHELNRILILPAASREPDYLVLGGLRRRQLLNEFEPQAAPGLGSLLKPSNSLFIPPEFRSVNCLFCNGIVVSHTFRVDGSTSANLYTGEVGVFDTEAMAVDCDGRVITDTLFGDGASASREVFGPVADAVEFHAYSSTGNFTATSFVTCPCSIFAFSDETASVGVTSPPNVTIQSASVPSNSVSVLLEPSGLSGDLVVEVLDPATAHQFSSGTRSGGTHSISLDRNSIPNGEYTKVRATWTVNGQAYSDEFSYHFEAFGVFRHSQYNTPTESDPTCSTGSSRIGFVTTGAGSSSQCFLTGATYYSQNFRSVFLSQAKLNGSAKMTTYGDVQWDQFCTGQSTRPPGVTSDNVYRQQAIVPACSGGGLSTSTVAVNFTASPLSCGDTIYIDGVGQKTVTDACPGCSSTQADNYTNDGRCASVPDLGDYRTFQLH